MHHSALPAAADSAAEQLLSCPDSKQLRARLRAMAADLVASWRAGGTPATARSRAGLREQAARLVERAGARADHIGWTMVTIVSEFWRGRLASGPSGRRLLLLPDCPAGDSEAVEGTGIPATCGPGCGIATIWAAARDSGWTVESTSRAVSAIGSLLAGQYDGILGVARLRDLEKAFGMLPAFALPVAAVPYEPLPAGPAASAGCAEALTAEAIDVEWVLGLLGVAGSEPAAVEDHLPLLREAAEMFTPDALAVMTESLGLTGLLGDGRAGVPEDVPPVDAAAALSADFLARGGKFLRPFVTLAAYDAVAADAAGQEAADAQTATREAVRAAAVAIEIFHKASLVHDDIEDDDAMRYGRSTLHVERGIPSALNAGDYLLGAGYRIVTALPGLRPQMMTDLVGILADAHVRLAKGQGAELWWRDAADRGLAPADALAIYGLKTSPAFEAAVAMGIRLAGLQPAAAAAIDRYALHVGTGFQVLNDLKDWGGDLENDRRAAGDLLGGRPTLLWALALEGLPAPDGQRLRSLAAEARSPATPDARVGELLTEARGLYERAGVIERALAVAAEQRRLAAEAVAGCQQRRLREVL
ncbi:MAG: polyprenyl synthetase family protein, partial [Planctomycetota bacterium]|nr:polyprenyl synthetase family protein [Planctomycetota bacterium]